MILIPLKAGYLARTHVLSNPLFIVGMSLVSQT